MVFDLSNNIMWPTAVQIINFAFAIEEAETNCDV